MAGGLRAYQASDAVRPWRTWGVASGCIRGCRLWGDVAAARWGGRPLMGEGAGGGRRLRAGAWVFDSALALLAATVPTALYVFEPPNLGLPRGRFVLGCVLVL